MLPTAEASGKNARVTTSSAMTISLEPMTRDTVSTPARSYVQKSSGL